MVVNLAGLEAAAKSLKGSSIKLLSYGNVLCFPFSFSIFYDDLYIYPGKAQELVR